MTAVYSLRNLAMKRKQEFREEKHNGMTAVST